jgi:ATP-binding cassette, subfamily B, bacterial
MLSVRALKVSGLRPRNQSPEDRQALNLRVIQRIIPYLKPYRVRIVLFLLGTIVNSLMILASPFLVQNLIDRGIIEKRIGLIVLIAGSMAALAVLEPLLAVLLTRLSASLGNGLVCDLRTDVYGHLLRQSVGFFARTPTGSLVSRLTNDVSRASQAVTSVLSSFAGNIITIVAVLTSLFYLSWQIAAIGVSLIPLLIIPPWLTIPRRRQLAREGMQQNAVMSTTMTERFCVPGAMLTRFFGDQAVEVDAFGEQARRARDLGTAQSVWGQASSSTLSLIGGLAVAGAFGIGAILVVDRSMQIGTLVAVTALLARIWVPLSQMSGVQATFTTGLVSLERILEVLDLEPAVTPGPIVISTTSRDEATTDPVPGMEFESVYFRYPDEVETSLPSLRLNSPQPRPASRNSSYAVSNVSFTVPSGKVTAIVGSSGAGKTTLAYLATRLYDPTSGVIRVNGQNIKDLTLSSLYRTMSMVTQDVHLFHDTLRNNLAYACPDASDWELISACKDAEIWDFIAGLPDGLDTVVGDHGYRLSGGEKQRVALARVLLGSPQIIVLDEATAHLDVRSEAAVRRTLARTLVGRTCLIITHRLSTIQSADQILVINQGCLVESGRHEELLAAQGVYASLHAAQFTNHVGA